LFLLGRLSLKSWLKSILSLIFGKGRNQRSVPVKMNALCMRCGCAEAFPINTSVKPDFDLKIIPPDLRDAFSDHADAICSNCGLYQAYKRFSGPQIAMINGIGKDALTTDEIYHSYPVPEEFINDWFGDSVERQRRRWGSLFHELGVTPKRILVLRHWFGRQFPMLVEEFGAEVFGVDISPICNRYVAEHYPFVRQLAGTINGELSGPFLSGEPFDIVIVQHILVHSVDVPKALAAIRHMLRNGGVVVLSAETKRAPSNPFHTFYPSEYQTVSMLSEVFDEVYKLDEQGIIRDIPIYGYSGRATEFAAVVKPAAS